MALATTHQTCTRVPRVPNRGPLLYVFSEAELATVQQLYEARHRYVTTARAGQDTIWATILVEHLLGLPKELTYVPASTACAILSQCCGLVAWHRLCRQAPDPTGEYTRLCQNELLGWTRETSRFFQRIPRGTPVEATIHIVRTRLCRDADLGDLHILLPGYLESSVRCFALRGHAR